MTTALTPVSNFTIISGHRTLDSQIVLRAHGLAGRKYLERFVQSGTIEKQLGAACTLNGDDLIIYKIPAEMQAVFDKSGAVVGASWSVWDAGNDPLY